MSSARFMFSSSSVVVYITSALLFFTSTCESNEARCLPFVGFLALAPGQTVPVESQQDTKGHRPARAKTPQHQGGSS